MLTVQHLSALRESLPPATPENANLREDLLVETRKLLLSLERPDNVVERVGFQALETITISLSIRMGLLRAMEDGVIYAVEELATATHCNPLLVERILRSLTAFGAMAQIDINQFALNNVSRTFKARHNEAAMQHLCEFLTPGWLKLRESLKDIDYQNPESATKTALSKAYKPEGGTVFEIMVAESQLDAFSIFMGSINEGLKEWFNIYPVEQRLAQGFDNGPEAVMIVDVGGGFGHQAINLKKKFPNLPGRFVVQDLAHGLPKERPDGIEFMAHDFTMPQPVKNARLYYLRWVIHDWPQEFCVKLISNIRSAMKPGYSRLIVNELVVPAIGASKFMTVMDMNMMAVTGGMERTEALHRDYLEKAGLKVSQIYLPGDMVSAAVIEAEVA